MVAPQTAFVDRTHGSVKYMRIANNHAARIEPVGIEQMKKDLGIHVSDTEPVDAPVGALWVDTSV